MLARSAGDPASLVTPLREVARSLDPNMPIYNVRTMEKLYRMRAVDIFNVLGRQYATNWDFSVDSGVNTDTCTLDPNDPTCSTPQMQMDRFIASIARS